METTNISEQIMSVINQVAEKLGVAAEKVYPILRKQAYVEGLSNIFWMVVVSILTILLIKYWIQFISSVIEKEKDEDLIPAKWIVTIVIIGVGFIFLPSIKDTITAFLNPDWYVFNELLLKLIK